MHLTSSPLANHIRYVRPFVAFAATQTGRHSQPGSGQDQALRAVPYTDWFVALTVGLGLFFLFHLLRVRTLTRAMNARFEDRLAERTRAARELHDTLLQTVHGSKLVVDHALRDADDHDRLVQALEQLSVWLGQAASEGRTALRSLQPAVIETDTLADAFRRAIDECRRYSAAEMGLLVRGRPRAVPRALRDDVYRIGYEAIRNACIHSRANRIDVFLEYSHDLTVRIRDNGTGFDTAAIQERHGSGSGLHDMRERAQRIGGTFTLHSSPDFGTAVTLHVRGRIAFPTGSTTNG